MKTHLVITRRNRLLLISVFLFLIAITMPAFAAEPKRVLLLEQGPDGHPATTHEYHAGVRIIARLLANVPNLEIKTVRADEPWAEGPELLERADGAVLYLAEGAKWLAADPRRQQAFAKLAGRGGGLVALHWAMGTRDGKNVAGFVPLFGGCHGGLDRRYAVVETTLVVASRDHPVARGIADFRMRDEFYYQLKFAREATRFSPSSGPRSTGSPRRSPGATLDPMADVRSVSAACTFTRTGGAEYRRLVAQAILWAVELPIPDEGLPVDLPYDAFELAKPGPMP